jgi:hypothetical protein
MLRFSGLLLTFALPPVAVLARSAFAQSDTARATTTDTAKARSLTAIQVTGRADDLLGVASSASQGHIGSADLRLRPLTREGELLDYRLGVYHTEIGDFGSAGGAELHLESKLDGQFATIEAGENALARVALGTSKHVGSGDLLLGGELKSYSGPWALDEGIRKFSGLARYSWQRNASRFSLLGMGYRNRWNASDQIPERAVVNRAIDRFGYIDGTDGGNTQRYSLSGSWNHIGPKASQSVQLFGAYSDLSLFSNFTYFLDNPVQGDQFDQREKRVMVGANASHAQSLQALGTEHTVTLGLQSRADFLSPVGLYRTERRARLATVREDGVTETGTGLYVEAQSRWRPWLRTTLGTRGVVYTFEIPSDRPENSGRRNAAIACP